MVKIDFFSVEVSGDSLDGTLLRYYKCNSLRNFRFSNYAAARSCFDRLIDNIKSSINLYNSENKNSRCYEVIYSDIYEYSDKSLNFTLIYFHSLSRIPRIFKLKLSAKSFLLDSFDFNFKL